MLADRDKILNKQFLENNNLVALKWHLLIALCSLALFLKKLYFLVPCCSWFVPHGVECTYCKSLWIKASAKLNEM